MSSKQSYDDYYTYLKNYASPVSKRRIIKMSGLKGKNQNGRQAQQRKKPCI